MSILCRRLHHTVSLLRLPRLMVAAVAVIRVGPVMIAGMLVRCRERRFFKEMMDAMRCRGREKKNK